MNVGGGDSGGHGGQSQEFDINLAPIIDCFTVLITFMLASASFLAIGIIDSSVAASGPPAADAKPPAIRLDVEMSMQKEIQIKVSGKTKVEKKIPALNGEWDTAALIAVVEDLKRQWPDTKSLILTAADDVEYMQVIRIMEAVKSHIPSILLGGF